MGRTHDEDEIKARQKEARRRQLADPDACKAVSPWGWPCRRRARVRWRGIEYCVNHYRIKRFPVATPQRPKIIDVKD